MYSHRGPSMINAGHGPKFLHGVPWKPFFSQPAIKFCWAHWSIKKGSFLTQKETSTPDLTCLNIMVKDITTLPSVTQQWKSAVAPHDPHSHRQFWVSLTPPLKSLSSMVPWFSSDPHQVLTEPLVRLRGLQTLPLSLLTFIQQILTAA